MSPSELDLAGFRYDDVAHKYYVNGSEIPGVSYILKQSGVVDDRWFGTSTAKRDFGKSVHEACHYLDENDLDFATLHPLILARVRAYQLFKKEMGFVPVDWERPLFHPIYKYGGTFDRLGHVPGGAIWLVDLKTGAHRSSFDLQTAAYEGLVREWPGLFGMGSFKDQSIRRVSLMLKEDETYDIKPSNNPRDWATFVAALTVTNWKETNPC